MGFEVQGRVGEHQFPRIQVHSMPFREMHEWQVVRPGDLACSLLGRWMQQSDDNRQITIPMRECSAALQEVERDASWPDDEPLGAQQLAQLRASVGQLSRLAKQGRPDISFPMSHLQQNMIDATVSIL